MRSAAFLCLLAVLPAWPQARVAVFRADATPAMGEPLIWTMPTVKVEDPLWAKGIVLESSGERYVICALDWCGVGGATYRMLVARMAKAAGTTPSRVTLHSVHQHTAPYIEGDAYGILRGLEKPPLLMSDGYLNQLAGKLAAAIREASYQPFDRVGTGQARVEQVASIRRLPAPGGKVTTRYSSDGVKPEMAAAPEGPVDPMLRTITLASGSKPLVRLHYYATHPQTFCCDGTVTADFVGAARAQLEKEEGIAEIYFTGCSGDVTVGKYNDRTVQARQALAGRLLTAMRASAGATRYQPAGRIRWRTAAVSLPKRAAPDFASAASDDDRYRRAIGVAFARRTAPLAISVLEIGSVQVLHLPGEPMLEFQKFAQRVSPAGFIAVAGYGDVAPGYLCTDEAFPQGGYEPSASNAGPGTEPALKSAIQALLSGHGGSKDSVQHRDVHK